MVAATTAHHSLILVLMFSPSSSFTQLLLLLNLDWLFSLYLEIPYLLSLHLSLCHFWASSDILFLFLPALSELRSSFLSHHSLCFEIMKQLLTDTTLNMQNCLPYISALIIQNHFPLHTVQTRGIVWALRSSIPHQLILDTFVVGTKPNKSNTCSIC